MDTFLELVIFLKEKKKLWLIPIVMIMVGIGWLLVAAQGSIYAPFIYTLF